MERCGAARKVLRLHDPPIMRVPQTHVPARFADRRNAGAVLASHLRMYQGRSDLVVLALPRGGVPVAYEVARALEAPLDVFVVRKLGVPGHPEFAMGAIAGGGISVFDQDVIAANAISERALAAVVQREQVELARREKTYRASRPSVPVAGQVVIVVDDGLATGSTMRAAVLALRRQRPAGIVVAVPVGSRQACAALTEVADQVICALTPEPFSAVGLWYADFSETTDDEVRSLLEQSTLSSPQERSA
jgi:putative phosphoribosyl transferase